MNYLVKHIKTTAMTFGLAVMLPFTAMANNSNDEQSLRALLDKYNGFSANFSQTVVDSEQNVIHSALGQLKFEQPGRFIWQINEPEPEVLVSNGETLWWYNPFIEEVSLYDASQAVAKTPFALLVSQDDATWGQFHIAKNQGGYTVQPKDLEQAQVVKLELRFTKDTLESIDVIGRTQQVSQYRLTNPVFADVDDEMFNFVIPPGTDIDDQRNQPLVKDGNVAY